MSAVARVRAAAARRPHEAWLALIVLFVLGAHLAIANIPRDRFVFDEAYYVPAAEAMIAGQPANAEHPPLAKALIALSILALGDHGIGWRLPSILAGTLAIVLLYLLTARLGDKKTALLAAFLLGFENLWFVHSSVAMLDIVAVALGLASLLLLVRGEWVMAGAVVGLSMLAKESMGLLVGVAAAFVFLRRQPGTPVRQALRQAGEAAFFVGAGALVVFMAGLQIYDSAYGGFPTAFHHVAHMVEYNRAIEAVPLSEAAGPLRWFSGFTPAPYFVTSTPIGKDLQQTYIQYVGQPNLVVVLLAWLALPAAFPLVRRRDPHAALHVALFLLSWGFFIAVALVRITYPYYMLVMIPSLCALVAAWLARLPRSVILTYAVGVVVWFLFWFPVNLLSRVL